MHTTLIVIQDTLTTMQDTPTIIQTLPLPLPLPLTPPINTRAAGSRTAAQPGRGDRAYVTAVSLTRHVPRETPKRHRHSDTATAGPPSGDPGEPPTRL